MNATTQRARSRFALDLRRALDVKGTSVRALARRLNPESPETARSNLMRWLRGAHLPSRTSRRAVAIALDLDPAHFESDDDEEADPVADLFTALMRVVDERVRAQVVNQHQLLKGQS